MRIHDKSFVANNTVMLIDCSVSTNEAPHEKPNNVVFEQVGHKQSCTNKEYC